MDYSKLFTICYYGYSILIILGYPFGSSLKFNAKFSISHKHIIHHLPNPTRVRELPKLGAFATSLSPIPCTTNSCKFVIISLHPSRSRDGVLIKPDQYWTIACFGLIPLCVPLFCIHTGSERSWTNWKCTHTK